jgi:GntR family transcriptional regulator/MocR family aminotransferase
VGWLVAPPAVHARLLAARERAAVRPAPAGQLVFAELAGYGDLARHLRRLRRELAERRRLVLDLCHRAGVTAVGDPAGAHLRLELPNAAAERSVVVEAAANGVALPALADYHLGPPRRHGVSIGFAAPAKAELHRAVALVAGLAAAHGGTDPCRYPR